MEEKLREEGKLGRRFKETRREWKKGKRERKDITEECSDDGKRERDREKESREKTGKSLWDGKSVTKE